MQIKRLDKLHVEEESGSLLSVGLISGRISDKA